MPDRSTEPFDPIVLATRGRSYRGTIALSQLARLRIYLDADDREADYSLSFRKEGKLLVVVGEVNAELVLQCQVCLEKLVRPVSSEIRLGIVSTVEEISILPEEYEPLLVPEKNITLREIVEEELLLAIPIIPRHEKCEAPRKFDSDSPGMEKVNPFSVLAELKSSGDQ